MLACHNLENVDLNTEQQQRSIQMEIFFEVTMIDGHCPSETCSMGLYKTRELAEAAIAKERPNYSDHMIFEIEEKAYNE